MSSPTFALLYSGNTAEYPLKSSSRVAMYRVPPMEGGSGPIRSACTSCSGSELADSDGAYDARVCLPSGHGSHASAAAAASSSSDTSMPCTMPPFSSVAMLV